MIGFRPAAVDDLDDLHRVWWATEREPGRPNPWFAHVLGTGHMAVAARADRIVGFAGRRRVGANTVITDCFVEPTFQGQGVATKLLRYLLPPGEPLLVLASTDPRARALYGRLGMRSVTVCPYLAARSPHSSLSILNTTTFPAQAADVTHLTEGLGARLLTLGRASFAAVTATRIESSVVSPDDDPVAVLTSLVAHVGGEVSVQMSEEHAAYSALESTETDRDVLMATPGATLPDYTRVTFNGDLLAVG